MRRQRENDTRERLISAAIDVFAERGYADVTTRDLAKRADVTLSAIGYHFGTKLELYQAAAQRVVASMADPVAACISRHPIDGDDPGAALLSYMRAVAGIFLSTGAAEVAASRFSMRELSVDGPARDIIVDRIINPAVGHASALLRAATGGGIGEEAAVARGSMLFGPITLYRLLNNRLFMGMDEVEAEAARQVVHRAVRDAVLALVGGGEAAEENRR